MNIGHIAVEPAIVIKTRGGTRVNEWICTTCGTQYVKSDAPPSQCSICEDERQYIGSAGQTWTTLEKLQRSGYRNAFYGHESNLIGVETVPEFAIGQHAKLLRTPHGNILWDCISYVDDVTVDLIRGTHFSARP